VNDDSLLRKKAREVMDSGRLPDRAPDHIWGGPGTGADCAVCGHRIEHKETELEIEFVDRNGADSSFHLVHLRCFSALEGERQSRVGSRVSASRDASNVA
jgi:hypothetical protein